MQLLIGSFNLSYCQNKSVVLDDVKNYFFKLKLMIWIDDTGYMICLKNKVLHNQALSPQMSYTCGGKESPPKYESMAITLMLHVGCAQ